MAAAMCGPAGATGSRDTENDGSLTSIWTSIADSVSELVMGTRVSRRLPPLLDHSYPECAITTYTNVHGGVRSGISFTRLAISASVGADTTMATGSHAGGV